MTSLKERNDDGCYDIIFLALARDCAEFIPGLLAALQRLSRFGLKVHALVGENGSTDNTRELLEEATARNDLISVIDTSFMSMSSERLQRMARGRQFLADYGVRSFGAARAFCVVDVDEPFLESLKPAALQAALERVLTDRSIFAVSATSRPTYYDLLAFEDDERSYAEIDKQMQYRQGSPWVYYKFFRDVVYPAQQQLTADSELVCRSAFNGLCLYSADAYAIGSYLSPDDNSSICEHVILNRSIATATERHMIIDAALVLPTPVEHGPRKIPGFVWQRLKKFPRLVYRRAMAVRRSGT